MVIWPPLPGIEAIYYKWIDLTFLTNPDSGVWTKAQVFPEILTQGQNEKKMSQPKLGHFQVPLGLVKSRGPKKVGISQPLWEILAQKGPKLAQKGPKLAQMAEQLFRDLTIQKRPFPTCFNVLRMTPSWKFEIFVVEGQTRQFFKIYVSIP